MDRIFSVAALQSKPQKTLDANLCQVQTPLVEAVQQGANMVVLGENFAYHGQSDLYSIGQSGGDSKGPVRQFLSEQARQLGLWIIGGTIPVLEPSQLKPYARSLIYNPEGHCAGQYDKIHLFDALVQAEAVKRGYCESEFYDSGASLTTLKTDHCNLGLSICYDLSFLSFTGSFARVRQNLLLCHQHLLQQLAWIIGECYLELEPLKTNSLLLALT